MCLQHLWCLFNVPQQSDHLFVCSAPLLPLSISFFMFTKDFKRQGKTLCMVMVSFPPCYGCSLQKFNLFHKYNKQLCFFFLFLFQHDTNIYVLICHSLCYLICLEQKRWIAWSPPACSLYTACTWQQKETLNLKDPLGWNTAHASSEAKTILPPRSASAMHLCVWLHFPLWKYLHCCPILLTSNTKEKLFQLQRWFGGSTRSIVLEL